MTAMSSFPPRTAQTERQWAFSREFLVGYACAECMEREERIRRIDEELDRVLGPDSKRERVLEQ